MKFLPGGRAPRSSSAAGPRAEAWLSSEGVKDRFRAPGFIASRCGNADAREPPRKLTAMLAGVLPHRQPGRDKRRTASRSGGFVRASLFACGSKNAPESPACTPLADDYMNNPDLTKVPAKTRFDFAGTAGTGERRSHSPPEACSPYSHLSSPRDKEVLGCLVALSQRTAATLRRGRSHSASRAVADRFRSRRRGRALSDQSAPLGRGAPGLDGCDSLIEELERAWMELEDHRSRCVNAAEDQAAPQAELMKPITNRVIEPAPQQVPSPASLLSAGTVPGPFAGTGVKRSFAVADIVAPLQRQHELQSTFTLKSLPSLEQTQAVLRLPVEQRTVFQPLTCEQNPSSQLAEQLRGGCRTTSAPAFVVHKALGQTVSLEPLGQQLVSPLSMASPPTTAQTTPHGLSVTQTSSTTGASTPFTPCISQVPTGGAASGSPASIGTVATVGTAPKPAGGCSDVGTGRLHEAQALLSEMFTPSASSSARPGRRRRRNGSAPHILGAAHAGRRYGSAPPEGTAPGLDGAAEERQAFDDGVGIRSRRHTDHGGPLAQQPLVTSGAAPGGYISYTPITGGRRGRGGYNELEEDRQHGPYGGIGNGGGHRTSRSGSSQLRPLNGSMPWFPAGDSPPKQQSSTPECSRPSTAHQEVGELPGLPFFDPCEGPSEEPAHAERQRVPQQGQHSPQFEADGSDTGLTLEVADTEVTVDACGGPLNTQDVEFCNLLAAALAAPPPLEAVLTHRQARAEVEAPVHDEMEALELDMAPEALDGLEEAGGTPISLGLSPSVLAFSRDRDSVADSDVVQAFIASEDEGTDGAEAAAVVLSPVHGGRSRPELFLMTPSAAIEGIASPLSPLEVLDV